MLWERWWTCTLQLRQLRPTLETQVSMKQSRTRAFGGKGEVEAHTSNS